MTLSADQIEQWLADAPVDQVKLVGLRIALRSLPMVTMGQNWSEQQQFAFLELMRSIQALWASVAYDRPGGTGWSEERIDYLKALWRAGRSASEIADYLGGVSRNAVIGKAHRLGLDSRSGAPFEGVYNSHIFQGDTQNAALFATIAGIWPRRGREEGQTSSGPQQAIAPLLHAASGLSQIYPSFSADKVLEAIGRDIEFLVGGLAPHEVATMRLWQPRAALPVRFEVPTSPPGWGFWRRWYDARRLGRPTERHSISEGIDRAITRLPDDIWGFGPAAVNEEISQIVRTLREQDRVELIEEGVLEDVLPDPKKLGSVEPQSVIALNFNTSLDGRIDVDIEPHPETLQTDADARDRHTEVGDSARDLVALYERFGLGGNVAEALIQQAERLLEALGRTPEEVRPGLLIPRGERLRQKLAAQQKLDELGAEPPLPAQFLTSLEILVGAYNVYVALDPLLARRDQAQLDPDSAHRLIRTKDGTDLVTSAVDEEIATPAVQAVLDEEALVAPAIPDADRRESRRYSESIRNFVRVAVDKAFMPLKALWKHRGAVQSIGAGISKFAKWVAAHGDPLLALFPENSGMQQIIRFVVEAVKKWS